MNQTIRCSKIALCLALGLWLTLPGCTDSRQGLGLQCDRNSECQSPLVCHLTRCRTQCASTRDCPQGSLCVRDDSGVGACRLEPEETCARASDCPGALQCLGGACTEACATDADCAEGSWCDGEAGERGCASNVGVACTASTECPTGLRCADDGVCRPRCRADVDCDFGEGCGAGICSPLDGGTSPALDAGADAGTDAGAEGDAGEGSDAGGLDGGSSDAGTGDAGEPECTLPTDCVADHVATADCVSGVCTVIECVSGYGDCDAEFDSGCELDLTTDAANCGVCGGSCGAGGLCAASVCDTVVDVASGTFLFCVTRSSGTVLCSGPNHFGGLGRGTTSFFRSGLAPMVGLSDATGVDCGAGVACALRGASASCAGNDEFGQVGDGGGFAVGITVPTAVSALSDVAAISSGGVMVISAFDGSADVQVGFTCARQSSGAVLCWGAELYRGDGGVGDAPAPVTVPGLMALDVSAGGQHVCAVRVDNTVVCWGAGGEWLGPAGGADSATPVVVSGITDATNVSAGPAHTCVRRSTGAVSCWGQGPSGELGAAGGASASPVHAVGITDAIDVETGEGFTCALRTGGRISCWGDNTEGQLGLGTTSAGGFMPTEVPGLTGATVLALSNEACALRTDGAVVCWGDGTSLSPTVHPDFPATPTP